MQGSILYPFKYDNFKWWFALHSEPLFWFILREELFTIVRFYPCFWLKFSIWIKIMGRFIKFMCLKLAMKVKLHHFCILIQMKFWILSWKFRNKKISLKFLLNLSAPLKCWNPCKLSLHHNKCKSIPQTMPDWQTKIKASIFWRKRTSQDLVNVVASKGFFVYQTELDAFTWVSDSDDLWWTIW